MAVSLTRWLKSTTPARKRFVAALAKTSVKSIEQIASGFRGGSAATAVRLAKASDGEIDQGSVCAACKTCAHYKAARK